MNHHSVREYNDIRAHVDTVEIRSTVTPTNANPDGYFDGLLYERLVMKGEKKTKGYWRTRLDPNIDAIGGFNQSSIAAQYNQSPAGAADGIQKRLDLLVELGSIAENAVVWRIDIAIDNNEADFSEWSKLNRYLHLLFIAGFGIPIRDRNGNRDEVTHVQKGFRAQKRNKHGYKLEMEIYDKQIQNPDAGVKTRVELRRKQLRGESVSDVCTAWAKVLRKLMEYAPQVQREQNEQLAQEWLRYQRESDEAIKPQEFIRRSRDYIFTRKQLNDLHRRIGVTNPSAKTGDFLKRNDLELCENASMEQYISVLIAAVESFRDSPPNEQPSKHKTSRL